MDRQKLISVVIPAYNAQNTIKRCVDSVRKQTYTNIEILVVNDGSTDDTGEVVNKISSDDSRVKLITVPNGGVSRARNIGIDKAAGDYIAFLDSDDTIESEMYSFLMSLAVEYNVKIAHCSYANVDEGGNRSVVGDTGKILVQNRDEALECLLLGKYFTGGLWNKLYSSYLFKNVRLDESIKFNEDVLFNVELFLQTDKSVYSDRALYNYYANPQSATHSARGYLNNEQCTYASEKMYELCKGEAFEEAAYSRMVLNYLLLYSAYVFSGLNRKDSRILQTRKKLKFYYKSNAIKGRNNRIKAFALLYCRPFYKFGYKLYDKIRVKKLDPEQ